MLGNLLLTGQPPIVAEDAPVTLLRQALEGCQCWPMHPLIDMNGPAMPSKQMLCLLDRSRYSRGMMQDRLWFGYR